MDRPIFTDVPPDVQTDSTDLSISLAKQAIAAYYAEFNILISDDSIFLKDYTRIFKDWRMKFETDRRDGRIFVVTYDDYNDQLSLDVMTFEHSAIFDEPLKEKHQGVKREAVDDLHKNPKKLLIKLAQSSGSHRKIKKGNILWQKQHD